MRSGETAEIEAAFRAMNLGKLQVVEASKMFLGRLQDVIDPEEKRAVIGKAFVDLQDEILAGERFRGHDWMLGQGTIYPDTIESGGTQSAAVIKTHHNRVERIQELIDEGRVLEPLAEFYKDEVRELGRALGLAPRLLARHPFPGPGLAIRCICNGAAARPEPDAEIAAVAEQWGYRSFLLPLRSVGVQGDSRSYAKLTVLHDGPLDYAGLLPAATAITNAFRRTNRIVAALAPQRLAVEDWRIERASLNAKRVSLLQAADRMVTEFLYREGLYSKVWQCPVVLLPFACAGGETIALRPITSVDGMTAAVAQLPPEALLALARRMRAIDGIDAVVYDISHKPPSTIEWSSPRSFREEGEQPPDLLLAGLNAVLGDLECLRVLDRVGGGAVALASRLPPSIRDGEAAPGFQPGEPRARALGHLVENAGVPGQPFVKLRDVGVERAVFFLDYVVDRDDDVGAECLRLRETVGEIEKQRVLAQRRGIRDEVRHRDHVGRVLHQHAGIAVVGVVVVRTGRDHDVGVPLADLADDLNAHIQPGRELAVVVVEHFVVDAQPAARFLGLGPPARGENASAFGLMTRVAVGDGDELDLVAGRGVLGREAARLDVAVVGVRAECDDADFSNGWDCRSKCHGEDYRNLRETDWCETHANLLYSVKTRRRRTAIPAAAWR